MVRSDRKTFVRSHNNDCGNFGPSTNKTATVVCRLQQPRACFNCGDPTHFVIDCSSKDRACKLIQQKVNSCHTNPSGGSTCPFVPHGVNHEVFFRNVANTGNSSFLRQLRTNRTLSIRVHDAGNH